MTECGWIEHHEREVTNRYRANTCAAKEKRLREARF